MLLSEHPTEEMTVRVLFIYNGGQNGFRGNQPQKIPAASMPNGGAQGFGISVAGGIDVDKNGYPG